MGFTFDGVASKDMGIATRMDIENRIPSLRNNTEQIAGRQGIFDFGETVSERVIDISCFIPPGNNDTGLLGLKDRIVAWLNPDKGVKNLILDREPGRIYKARLWDSLSFEKVVRNTGKFDLSFFCPDPYAYAATDDVSVFTSSGTMSRMQGNVESHPLFEIKGKLSSQSEKLWFSVNGETVNIKGVLKASETLYIDTDDMTAWITASDGTEVNALGQMESLVFPYMKVGANSVSMGASGGTFTSLKIYARSRWL